MAELRRLIRRRSPTQPSVVLEGPRLVAEACEAGLRPWLVAVPASAGGRADVAAVVDRLDDGAEVLVVADAAFKSLAPTVSPQPMLAAFERPTAAIPEALAPADLVLVLVGVADPGNAGTIVRAAAACAARCVVISGGADPWAPKAVRASAGAMLRVPVAAAADPADALKALRLAGATIAATDVRQGVPHDCGVLGAGPLAVVVGSEARGLDRAALSPLVDHWVRIPMAAAAESLNAAMAATLLAYQARRDLSRGPARSTPPLWD